MSRMARVLFALLPVIVLLGACSGPEGTDDPTATVRADVEFTATSPAATPTATVTAAQPTGTPAPTATVTPTEPLATPTIISSGAGEVDASVSPTVEAQPEQADATGTAWVPVERPADQVVELPDVDAHYAVHVTDLNVDSGYVQASQTVTIQEFRGAAPDIFYFQVVPAGYGFFTLDGLYLNGEPIAVEWINNGFTLVVDLPEGAAAPLEIGIDFHLNVGPEATGWGYTALDADVLRLGYWFPLVSDDHPFSVTLDPSYTRVATFDVLLDLTPDVTPVYSGELVETQELEDGRLRYVMHAENVRDFDLALSRSYTMVSAQSASGVQIEYYWRGGLAPDVSGQVLAATADALDQLTNLIGPYPWPTLRVVDAGPTMPGGIEYANMIYINPAYEPLDRLIYHEVGHMWLYGIIGTRTLIEGWVDEGGAEFFERGLPTGFSERPPYPESGYGYALDSRLEELPQTGRDFYFSIYEQGAHFYYDVLETMGWDAFWAAMQQVYTTYQFDIVTAYDLLRTWQAHSSTDLRPLFEGYFRYPWIPDLPPPGTTTHQGWLPIAPG